MKHNIASVWLVGFLLVIVFSIWATPSNSVGQNSSLSQSPSLFYKQLQDHIGGEWQERGELFTSLYKKKRLRSLFLLVICAVPAVFLIHYLIVGAMEFSHSGKQILFFGLFTRIVHWIGAISFSILVITGLVVVFGSFLGGGEPIRFGRYLHIGAALVFTPAACCIFLVWVKDMFPATYDIQWIFMLGGYLSKEKKPVPAGKFNAGQKSWFWLATAGGGVMAYTGYIIWGFGADLDTVRLYTIIHNCLAAVMIAVFITHLYMSIFAIKGSLTSMKTGYKPQEEVDILHSKYKYK